MPRPDRCRVALAPVVLLALALGPGSAAPSWSMPLAHRVADLRPGQEAFASSTYAPKLRGFLSLEGGATFFQPDLGGDACQLWFSDGSASGTIPLANLCAQGQGDGPMALGSRASLAFYSDSVGALWRTDGTPAGTYRLGAGVRVDVSNFDNPTLLAADGRYLFFRGCSETGDCDLWRSDGSLEGTLAVFKIRSGKGGGGPRLLTPYAGRLFFVAVGGKQRPAVYEANADGTGAVERASVGPSFQFRALIPSGDRLYFVTDSSLGAGQTRIGTIDLKGRAGSDSSTAERLAQLPDKPFGVIGFRDFVGLDGLLHYLVLYDEETEIGVTDGTSAGTHLRPTSYSFASPLVVLEGRILALATKDFETCDLVEVRSEWAEPHAVVHFGQPCVFSNADRVALLAGRIYFLAQGSEGAFSLWSTDGTEAGTRSVVDLCSGCDRYDAVLKVVGDRIYLSDLGGDLWMSDGTPSGTARLAQTNPYVPNTLEYADLAEAAGRIFFSGFDPVHRFQLWTSDGTAGGTHLVALVDSAGASSDPIRFVALDDRVVFCASDAAGKGLFVSSPTGLARVAALGAVECLPYDSTGSFRAGRSACFVTYDPEVSPIRSVVWCSDGTESGTHPLPLGELWLVRQVSVAGGKALVVADDVTRGGEGVWRTDGTPAGTERVTVLDSSGVAGEAVSGSSPSPGDLYFFAGRPTFPFHSFLWRIGGAEAVPHPLLRTLAWDESNETRRVKVGDRLYFFADVGTRRFGLELFATDGTQEGTVPVEPSRNAPHPADPLDLAAFRGSLYYFAEGGKSGHPFSLWRSDGTPGSTRAIADFPYLPGRAFGAAPQLTVYRDALYFVAPDEAHGDELWVTDGTPNGTRLAVDLHPGRSGSSIDGLVVAGDRLYFLADDGVSGAELWISDGTPQGTRLVHDIAPGVAGSRPRLLTPAGDRLYFSADDHLTGREPWVLPLTGGDVCVPSPDALCIADGRYRVEAASLDGEAPASARLQALGQDAALLGFGAGDSLDAAVRIGDAAEGSDATPLFVAGLTDREHEVTVTELASGRARRYFNPQGALGSLADLGAFPRGDARQAAKVESEPERDLLPLSRTSFFLDPIPQISSFSCVPGPNRLCLLGGRFDVQVLTRFGPAPESAPATRLSDTSGAFDIAPFATPGVVVKLVDGRAVNGKIWVFAGSLTRHRFTLSILDTATGLLHDYKQPAKGSRSVGDTEAFP